MKTLYIISCVLLFAAVVAEANAKRYCSIAVQANARSVLLLRSEQTDARQKAKAAFCAANKFTSAGLAMAGLGVASWLVSMSKGRKGTPVIPLSLAAAYVLLYFTLV